MRDLPGFISRCRTGGGSSLTLLAVSAVVSACAEHEAARPGSAQRVQAEAASSRALDSTARRGRILYRAQPRPVVPPVQHDCAAGERIAVVEVREVRADERAVYVDLDHTPALDEERGAAGRPTVFIYADGCPAGRYTPDEEVTAGVRDGATLSIPAVKLPDGDLTLTFAVMGATATIYLRKEAGALASIDSMDRKLLQRVKNPDDPDGPMDVVEMIPDCPKDENAEAVK